MVKLSSNEIDQIVTIYEERLDQHGFDVAALKSGGLGKQFVRHSVHAHLFDLAGRSIIDVGCGLGMFYKFLRDARVPLAAYCGIDIVAPFLEHNRAAFPEATFVELDIANDPISHLNADVVFISQVFNARFLETDNKAFAKHVVSRFFQAAREGLVVDFMSSYVDYREDDHVYYNPEEMFAFAKSLTPFVSIRHDYLPFEFSLALRHSPIMPVPHSDEVRAYD